MFDVARLESWLHEYLIGFRGPLRVERFKGGQSNPTFLLQSDNKRWVLRRKPPGALLSSAHAVEREYRIIRALADTDVPVARAHALCEDPSVIGSNFYVMDYVDGRIYWDPHLPECEPAERAALFDEMNRVIAALHRIDPASLDLGGYGKPSAYIERQIARWTRQYRASETERIDAMERLIDWLPQHLPAEGAHRIIHGDYRIDNVIFHPTEPQILAVLDWELSTLGDPIADFAYHCMNWRLSPRGSRGLAGVDLAGLGIPNEASYVQKYFDRVGRPLPDASAWTYYLVFNMFRLVGILQGVAARALQGNASSVHAAETGRRARPLAEQAWALAQSQASIR